MTDGPTLEDALEGLLDATNYAEDRNLDDIADRAGKLYQELGAEAPGEDWEGGDSE
jgi:hypothetical protein